MPSSLSIISASALTLLGVAGLVVQARAHATLDIAEARPDSTHRIALRVPHGCDGQSTHTVRIVIPEGVLDVKPMPKPGWTLDIVRGRFAKTYQLSGKPVSEGVKELVWSKGDLPDAHYDEFVFRARPTGDLAGRTIAFPSTQECATAKAAWIEIASPGQDPHALKMPAPTLKVAAQTASAPSFKAGPLVVEAPWARATPTGAKVGGGYLVVRNTGTQPDKLIGFSSPAAGRGEVHEMAMSDGVMKMREIRAIDIPPGGTVELKPGGLHLMFVDLRSGLVEGRPVKGRLVFEKAGPVEVEFRVAPIGGSAPSGSHSHH